MGQHPPMKNYGWELEILTASDPVYQQRFVSQLPLQPYFFGIQISGRLMYTFNTDADNSMLGLSIHKKVITTESYIPNFSFPMFVADLGGSLGLWLGVGVVQILGSVHHFYVWIMSNKGF